MAETIEFVSTWYTEVDNAQGRVRQVTCCRGTRMLAVVRPVENGKHHHVNLVDLLLPDGMTARHVPRAKFAVVAQQTRAA